MSIGMKINVLKGDRFEVNPEEISVTFDDVKGVSLSTVNSVCSLLLQCCYSVCIQLWLHLLLHSSVRICGIVH